MHLVQKNKQDQNAERIYEIIMTVPQIIEETLTKRLRSII